MTLLYMKRNLTNAVDNDSVFQKCSFHNKNNKNQWKQKGSQELFFLLYKSLRVLASFTVSLAILVHGVFQNFRFINFTNVFFILFNHRCQGLLHGCFPITFLITKFFIIFPLTSLVYIRPVHSGLLVYMHFFIFRLWKIFFSLTFIILS